MSLFLVDQPCLDSQARPDGFARCGSQVLLLLLAKEEPWPTRRASPDSRSERMRRGRPTAIGFKKRAVRATAGSSRQIDGNSFCRAAGGIWDIGGIAVPEHASDDFLHGIDPDQIIEAAVAGDGAGGPFRAYAHAPEP